MNGMYLILVGRKSVFGRVGAMHPCPGNNVLRLKKLGFRKFFKLFAINV